MKELREKIARIIDPYIPQDLVCIGMEYEFADEILAIPEIAEVLAASGMEAAKPSRRETGSTEGDSPVAKPDAHNVIDYSGMEPRKNPRQPIFRNHDCGGCDSGSKPCREGNYNNCSQPRARND